MADTLDTFSVSPASAPASDTPEAPAEAFAGTTVGRSLSAVGDEFYKVGKAEYDRANLAQAQEGETEFMKGALALEREYKTTHFNKDAVVTHKKYTDAVDALRQQIQSKLPTKHAQEVYASNALRTQRFAQEGMDSHMETQNRRYQLDTYKTGQAVNAQLIASAAADGKFDKVEEGIKAAADKARSFADSMGMSAEETEDHITRAKSMAADGAIHAAVKNGQDLGKVEKFFEAHRGELDPKQQSEARAAMISMGAKNYATNSIDGAPTQSGDADGLPTEDAARATLRADLKDQPEKLDLALREFNIYYGARKKEFLSSVEQKYKKVIQDALTDRNGVPKQPGQPIRLDYSRSSQELAWLARNAPATDDVVGKMSLQNLYEMDAKAGVAQENAATKAAKRNAHDNLIRLNADLMKMAETEPDKLRSLGMDGVNQMMSKYPGGVFFEDLSAMRTMLKAWQGREKSPISGSWTSKTIRELAKAQYPTNAVLAAKATAAAGSFVLDEIKPDMDPAVARKRIDEFLKGDWRSYEDAPKVEHFANKPEKSAAPPPASNATVTIHSPDGKIHKQAPAALVDKWLESEQFKGWHK